MNLVSSSRSCTRCGDNLDQEFSLAERRRNILLNAGERSFINAKFNGTLCTACINQLKTSYKIQQGDFGDFTQSGKSYDK